MYSSLDKLFEQKHFNFWEDFVEEIARPGFGVGTKARQTVQQRFLMSRLLENYLDMFNSFETLYRLNPAKLAYLLLSSCPNSALRWFPREKWDQRNVVCSANGHAFTVTADSRLIAVIEELNTGKSVSVGTLMQRYFRKGFNTANPITRSTLRKFLEKLHSLRAIKKPG